MIISRRNCLKVLASASAGFGVAWKGIARLLNAPKVYASTQTAITGVSDMPNMPSPYNMRDWKSVAQGFDAFAFNFNATGQFVPVGAFIQNPTNYSPAFAIGSYVGTPYSPTGNPPSGESVTGIGAVVGATLSGIDKSNQGGQNYVAMCQNWFIKDPQYVYLDNPTSVSGAQFFYDLFPSILFYQLNYLYPNTGNMPHQFLSTANQWHAASVAMGGGTGSADYSYWAINLNNDPSADPPLNVQPVTSACGTQPDAAAGIAWIEYMAYVVTGTKGYRNDAEWAMEWLNGLTSDPSENNPFYEIFLPFGAYIAARMNAEIGTTYNTSQLVNWCFDGSSQTRPGWGVMNDTDNTSGFLNGLLGSKTRAYAFAMDSFEIAGALVPMVRYDASFAHDIGKWMLNLANSAANFYNGPLGTANQSSSAWTSMYDTQGVIAYEGVLNYQRGLLLASSDYSTTEGSIQSGDYTSTFLYEEWPQPIYEELEEALVGGTTWELIHAWTFNLPAGVQNGGLLYFVMSANASGNTAAAFPFQYSFTGSAPWTHMTTVPGTPPPASCNGNQPISWIRYCELPQFTGPIYIRVSSSRAYSNDAAAVLNVDAMGISYQSFNSPYGQSDRLCATAAFPTDASSGTQSQLILYKDPSVYTGLGLYGASHVGILGGIVSTTNITGLLSLDLLKTDYYHAPAYPSSLIYNPLTSGQSVQINVGSSATDLYDAVSHSWVATNVTGTTTVSVLADTAVVIVQVPNGATQTTNGNQLLANGIVIDWNVTA